MTDTKRRQDPIDNALRKCRQAPALARGISEHGLNDDSLKLARSVCTALLKLTPEQRQKVLAAAETLGA